MFFHFDFWPPRTTVVDDFGPREAFLRQRRAFLAIYPEKQRDPGHCTHMDTHEGAHYRGCLCCGANLEEVEAQKEDDLARTKAELSPAEQGWLEYAISHGRMPELTEG